jgi:hypothetical protein
MEQQSIRMYIVMPGNNVKTRLEKQPGQAPLFV